MPPEHTTSLDRRRFLTACAAGLGSISLAELTHTTSAQAAPARAGTTGAQLADVVLDALTNHRLVGIGESEGLQNHHDVLQALLTDPRVPGVVDDIVVEFGNARYQATVDRFIAGHPVDNAELRQVWRNTTQSPLNTWDAPVYEQFYRSVRAVNWALPASQQIRVLLGDPPIDWSQIRTPRQLLPFRGQRDSHAAAIVQREVLDKGRRALLCYGWGHLVHGGSLVGLIERRTTERVYTIVDLVPLAGDPGALATKLAAYQRNSVIPTAGTWLGAFDAGLMPPSLNGGPHSQPTNPWCDTKLGTVIDAGLYEGQPEQLTASSPNPAIYLDPSYWAELRRRNALHGNVVDLDAYRKEQPIVFGLQAPPRSQECGTSKSNVR
jgi:hypothetical protein